MVFELQPVLTRVEVERVLRAIAAMLLNEERLSGTGTDFSGRRWLRGVATQHSIRSIAKDFFSVQAIHSPLYSIAAGKAKGRITSVSSESALREQPIDAATFLASRFSTWAFRRITADSNLTSAVSSFL